MQTLRLASIPGDGIGQEVVPAAVRVLRAVEQLHGGLRFEVAEFPWSCEFYLRTGAMMPEDGLETLAGFDAILLGAVGNPALVPDHVSLWGLLIAIRRSFDLAVNIRPARSFRGIRSPLRSNEPFDLLVVRENSEGEYSEIGGRIYRDADEIALQTAVFSRRGVERAVRYAFDAAGGRRGSVTSATKSNGIVHTMPFWDEVFRAVGADYPGVAARAMHVDALAAAMVLRPETFDVVVASNLFGDILTDLSAALMGGVGLAASANLNAEGRFPPMFEPVHGSAPDISGRGIANPMGQIWSAALLLRHFDQAELADRVVEALDAATRDGCLTPDIGGRSTTMEFTDRVVAELQGR